LTAAPAAGDLISPAGATAVVQAAWDLHHKALVDHDLVLLAAFETGPALEVDAARDSTGDPYGPASQVVVSVPHQTSYPARFFAQVAVTAKGQPWIAFLVFTRADPRAPWMLDVMGAYAAAPTEITPPAVDAGGFLASSAARPIVDPTTVHGLLAEYWRSSTDNGQVPPAPLWAPGAWTTQLATQLARQRQGAVADNGLIGFYAYQAASSVSAYAFSQAHGWQIVCSAIHIQKTFRSTADKQVFQDGAQRRWGKSVPPGSHHEVTQNSIAVPCIEVPPAGSGQKVRVKGAQPFADVTTYK